MKTALDSGVDILIGLDEGKLSRLCLDENLGETVNNDIRLVLVDDTGLTEHAGVGYRAFNVHCEKSPVGIVDGERPGAFGRGSFKPAPPQRHVSRPVPKPLILSALRLMNPVASACW